MKIIHVVSGSLSSGAARGALWLHLALLENGYNSWLITTSEVATNLRSKNIHRIKKKQFPRNVSFIVNKLLKYLLNFLYPSKFKLIFSFGVDGYDIIDDYHFKTADIIHLHFINSMVSLESLGKIKKPIIWTMRDMWPFTGGCHYTLDCTKYIIGCSNCPQLKKRFLPDIVKYVFKSKNKVLHDNITYVGISKWISREAKKSHLLSSSSILTIPNNVKISNFKHISRPYARAKLDQLDFSKNTILIGAVNIHNPYKGFKYFFEAMSSLIGYDLQIAVFGKGDHSDLDKLPFPVVDFGFVSDPTLLNLIYSASDVFVSTSIQEAFGKTLVESMLSGTPVVCFDCTGPSDIVVHMKTGYKAILYDTNDLANGIRFILESNQNTKDALSIESVKYATANFDSYIVARQYVQLYKAIYDQ